MRAIWMYIGTGQNTRMSYFLPLSNQGADILPDVIMEDAFNQVTDEIEEVADNVEEVTDYVEEVNHRGDIPTMEDREIRIAEANRKLDVVLQKMKSIYINRIPNDINGYEKALDTMEKHIDRIPVTNDAALQRAACTFGQHETL